MNALRTLSLGLLLALTLLLPAAGDPLAATAVWAVCLFVLARSHPSGLLSFGCLYLLLLGVFHLGLVAPLALEATPAAAPAWTRSLAFPTAVSLVSIAFAAFTLGARFRGAIPHGVEPIPPRPMLFFTGAAVALLGAALLLVGGRQAGVFSAGYGEFFQHSMTADVRLFNVGLMVFPIGFVVAAVGSTRRQILAIVGGVVAVLAPLFLAGFRGPVIVHLATLMAVWAHKDFPAARRAALALAVVAVVLVPAVRFTRDTRGDLSEGLAAYDPLALFTEAGTSLYPLVITADRIDSGAEPLWLGRSYVTALGRTLPNLGQRASLDARGLTPNGWATLQADRWLYVRGGGIGFSGVAEPYLNFGRVGVVVFFFLLGLVLQRWESWLARDPFRAAAAAATFGFVLWTVRNEAMELFRSMAFAGLVVGGAWMVHRMLHRRARTPRSLAAAA